VRSAKYGITETGAGSAVASVTVIRRKTDLKCDRVPVPNGSLVVLNLEVLKQLRSKINAIMKKNALGKD
jgi:glyceraldehyde 3-phosphate dehydrogenase